MKSSSAFLKASCLISTVLALPQLPVDKLVTLTSCGNGRPVQVNTTSNGVPQKAFIFWTNSPSADSTPDVVLQMVSGAITGSGGSVRSNLTVPASTFRGISAAAPDGVIQLIAEYGKALGYQIEQDCIATIGPVAIGGSPSTPGTGSSQPSSQPRLPPQAPPTNATIPANEPSTPSSSQPTTTPLDSPALPPRPPSGLDDGPVVDLVLDRRSLPVMRLPWLKPRIPTRRY